MSNYTYHQAASLVCCVNVAVLCVCAVKYHIPYFILYMSAGISRWKRAIAYMNELHPLLYIAL